MNKKNPLPTSESSPLVSLVVLSWNTLDDTKASIENLRKQTYKNTEIVVVDNGSDDGSKEYLKKQSDITYIDLPENTGFTGGQISALEKTKGDYLFLVNSDAIVNNSWTEKALDIFKTDEKIAAIGGKVFEWNDTAPLHDTSNPFYSYQKVDLDLGYAATLRTGEHRVEVDSISGAAVIIRRDVIEKVGYFDARFFAYFEETDLFARFQKAGYSVVYEPSLHAWHQIAKSTRSKPYFYLYHMHRNRFMFAYKNFDDVKKFALRYTFDYMRARRRLQRNPDSLDDKARVDAYKWNRKNLTRTKKERSFINSRFKNSYDSIISSHRPGEDITVVIPSYNYAKFLPEAIESVLQQTHTPHRILVIDDGSKDNSVEIAKSYEGVEVVSKPNEGVIKTKNLGISMTTTTWTVFLDADDVMEKNYLESLMKTAIKTNADVIYCDMEFIGAKTGHFYSKEFSVDELVKGNFIHNSSLINSNLLKSLGGFKEEMAGGYEDWELYLALAEVHARFAYSRDTFLHYRQHHTATGRNSSAQKLADKLSQSVRDLHPNVYSSVSRNKQRRVKMAKQILKHPEIPFIAVLGIPVGVVKGVGDYVKGVRRHSVNFVRTYIHKKNERNR